MADDRSAEGPPGVLETLLTPLRLPGRMVTDIETLSRALLSLQGTAQRHLPSIDDRAGELVAGTEALQASIDRLEKNLDSRLKALQKDFNKRILAVEHEVRGMRPSLDQMARDIKALDQLLPDPSDGPLTRLKDTLTSS